MIILKHTSIGTILDPNTRLYQMHVGANLSSNRSLDALIEKSFPTPHI